MNVFSSLTNRIFFATATLAVLLTTVAIYIVNRAVSSQTERELHRGIEQATNLVNYYRQFQFDYFTREARLIADLPKLKAATYDYDPKTAEPIAKEYRSQLTNADVFAIADNTGRVVVRLGEVPDEALAAATIVHDVTAERDVFWPEPGGVLFLTSVPISPDIGTLILGVTLDHRQAEYFKQLTDSEIAFGVNGAIKSATLPESTWPALATLLVHPGTSSRITLNGEAYQAFPTPLAPAGARGQPMAIVLRSQTEQLVFLRQLQTRLALTAFVAVLAATLLSYAIARTVTRPLEAITSTMREMTASGDLSRRIPVAPEGRLQDEDARLLATTLNAMTDSIARFQREATQRERLSSLGRLSTVIAHEIRNPLMIIKTSLRSLRREDATPEQVRTAAADIDEEITRLNRIVIEVLDFARPIRFELEATDINALVEDAVRAATATAAPVPVDVALDRDIGPLTTDAGRLRQALVNVIGNAIQAMDGQAGTPGPVIRVQTARLDARRILVQVSDKGPGIAAEDLPRIFDPFFTTRRTGTGIGLAISRNIIEGLGGRISVVSTRERGTDVRIELPLDSRSA
jgi:signal transduction histidine kinase